MMMMPALALEEILLDLTKLPTTAPMFEESSTLL